MSLTVWCSVIVRSWWPGVLVLRPLKELQCRQRSATIHVWPGATWYALICVIYIGSCLCWTWRHMGKAMLNWVWLLPLLVWSYSAKGRVYFLVWHCLPAAYKAQPLNEPRVVQVLGKSRSQGATRVGWVVFIRLMNIQMWHQCWASGNLAKGKGNTEVSQLPLAWDLGIFESF